MTLPRSSWGTLLLAYKLVLGPGRPVFVRLMKWPFLALLASIVLQLALSAGAGPAAPGVLVLSPGLQAGLLLVQLAAALLTVPAFTAWIRWVADPASPVEFRWRRAEWVFVGRVIQIWLFSILLTALFAAVMLGLLYLTSSPGGMDWFQPDSTNVVGVGVSALMALIPTVCVLLTTVMMMARYGLSVVAAATGMPSDLRLASDASRPARWRMVWTLVLYVPTSLAAMVPIVVMGLIIAIMMATVSSSATMASVWGNLISAFLFLPVSLALYGVLAAIFCLYHRWLVLGDRSL